MTKTKTDAEHTEQLENGEICVICNEELAEDYGRPMACEKCGGEAVLAADADKLDEE